MTFGTPEMPDGLWWTVPYDGQPALKMFLPLDTQPDEPVILIWRGSVNSDAVVEFIRRISDFLTISKIESLMSEPPQNIPGSEFEQFVKSATEPGGHLFIAIHANEDMRMWGDGPRSELEGLTPEVGLAIRSPALQAEPTIEAIASLVQASLRWRGVPIADITPVLYDLATAQAAAYRRWWGGLR